MKHRAVHILLAGCIVLVNGCAFVDQKLDLTYDPVVRAAKGSGTVLLVKPEVVGIPKQGTTWVIGTVRNAAGMQTALVTTDTDIGDWVSGALIKELNTAGYRVEPVTAFPQNVEKGVQLSVSAVFVDDDIQVQDRVAGASAHMAFLLDLWKDGRRVKTLNITAKGGERYEGFFSPEKKNKALKKALQSAMQQAVPEIVGVFDR